MSENGVRFLPGQYNAICDVCGQKWKSSSMRKRWDGLMVCPHDYELRHPQDFLRSVPDKMAVPWSRPETPDVFVPYCTVFTSQGVADVGTADCAQADNTWPPVFNYFLAQSNDLIATMGGDQFVTMGD